MLFTRRFLILAPQTDAGSAGGPNPIAKRAEHAIAVWKMVQTKLPDVAAAVDAMNSYYEAHKTELKALDAEIAHLEATNEDLLDDYTFEAFDTVEEVAALIDETMRAHPQAARSQELGAAYKAFRS